MATKDDLTDQLALTAKIAAQMERMSAAAEKLDQSFSSQVDTVTKLAAAFGTAGTADTVQRIEAMGKSFQTAGENAKDAGKAGEEAFSKMGKDIKKTGEEAQPPRTFDKVEGQIKNMLQLKRQNDVVKHFVDSLSAVANIFYADTSLKTPFDAGR